MPEFQTWQLLLFPLFFGLGWLAARVDIKQVVRESRSLPASYFKGLNFLLNEEPDKAIDAFNEVVRVAPETIELHFALGSLFRRRGELERAIRLHQSLVDREYLPADVACQALSELGQDYMKAGLLDRAEEVFTRLRGTARDEEARRALLEIFQLEKDWERAIQIAGEMPGLVSQKEVAHYHCELAERDMANSRWEDARAHLETALTLDRACVRATLLCGDLLAREGKDADAITLWQRVENQNPVYLALAAPRLMSAYQRQGLVADGLHLLRGYQERYPSLDLLDHVFRFVLEHEGVASARALARDELQRNPTLLGLDRFLEARLQELDAQARADAELMKSVVSAHTRRHARNRCTACGFKARQHYWRCPACGGWETYPPRRAEDMDFSA
ncbi:lipopolysaccharide assembly protein B [Oryzomicrobium terrae]|uniref:Lipopolysaccharide assembly protein B n=1 Tax=Oryzomicrobium terrae TaxID=1735038 RepID=A0A5C1EBZ4_9RHOO|nr:lipopolysaccharide assembly protein LapB [Oryzomicrobium terrae]QEL65657.1 lipopolysaccharide assembly protein B [Oryzomicrobium terrae]